MYNLSEIWLPSLLPPLLPPASYAQGGKVFPRHQEFNFPYCPHSTLKQDKPFFPLRWCWILVQNEKIKIKLKLWCLGTPCKDEKTLLKIPGDCWRLLARWKTGHHRRWPAETGALNSAGLWVKGHSASESRKPPPGKGAPLKLQLKLWNQLDEKTT